MVPLPRWGTCRNAGDDLYVARNCSELWPHLKPCLAGAFRLLPRNPERLFGAVKQHDFIAHPRELHACKASTTAHIEHTHLRCVMHLHLKLQGMAEHVISDPDK